MQRSEWRCPIWPQGPRPGVRRKPVRGRRGAFDRHQGPGESAGRATPTADAATTLTERANASAPHPTPLPSNKRGSTRAGEVALHAEK
jgi:hypothetical protein